MRIGDIMKNKIIIIILLLALSLSLSGCIETGNGTSTDTIYGMEYNGLIYKTYSLYLTNDHPVPGKNGESGYTAIYTVSVNDKDLIQKLKDVEASGKKAKISYHNELWIWPPWEYTSDAVAIIDDVEVLP